jgi:hypothetical protein
MALIGEEESRRASSSRERQGFKQKKEKVTLSKSVSE